MDRNEHWEHVYGTNRFDEVSWYQPDARLSLELIELVAPDRSARIIDVGGGASTLVDGLIDAGYRNLTVLDLAPAALRIAQERLGAAAGDVTWIAADILSATLARASFDVWHDRAVFHFLTSGSDRQRYVDQVRTAVRPGGHVVIATFGEDGPLRCSGLDVARYSPHDLHAQFGDAFALVESRLEQHITPAGTTQSFTYCLCRVRENGRADAEHRDV